MEIKKENKNLRYNNRYLCTERMNGRLITLETIPLNVQLQSTTILFFIPKLNELFR